MSRVKFDAHTELEAVRKAKRYHDVGHRNQTLGTPREEHGKESMGRARYSAADNLFQKGIATWEAGCEAENQGIALPEDDVANIGDAEILFEGAYQKFIAASASFATARKAYGEIEAIPEDRHLR
jgi:hypothetical protein